MLLIHHCLLERTQEDTVYQDNIVHIHSLEFLEDTFHPVVVYIPVASDPTNNLHRVALAVE